jgi:hypothetical protein
MDPELDSEWQEWYALSPLERWRESEKLWAFYLSVEGRLIPNPILKVLSTLSTHEVRYLLMGGQACVFYGAAEFSRDCDIAIFCEAENLGCSRVLRCRL